MNISNIISLVRAQTGASANTVPDTQMLDYINLVYHDMENNIALTDQNYFYDSFITDLVAGQSEYALPSVKKIIGVYTKYSDDKEFYLKLSESDFGNLSEDLSFYQQNQSVLDGFYILGDNTLFICPTPDTDVVDGLKIDGIISLPDLTLDAEESDIRLHRNYFGTLIMGIKVYVYGALGMGTEKRDAKMDYEQSKSDMINDIKQRSIFYIESGMIDLDSLS